MIEFFWLAVFLASLFVVVKSAGWFIDAASDFARKAGVSDWLIGISLVSIGTSLPELATSIFSILKDEVALVADNIVGSNVANIFLIIGISAIVAGKLVVKRDLIDLDLPLLALTQTFFLFALWDKTITPVEGFLSLALYGVYVHYSIHIHNEAHEKAVGIRKSYPTLIGKIVISLVLLLVGANYTVKGLLETASAFGINSSLLAVTALAVGTSLPELTVSVMAAMRKRYELSIGNIIGSNVFNSAGIIGILSLLRPLPVSAPSFSVGIPFLIAATFLLILSSISRKIHKWEGMMYLVLYALFVAQLFV